MATRLTTRRRPASPRPPVRPTASLAEPLECRRLMASFAAHINFQPAGAPVPSGYVADTGAAYGARNGRTYGWNGANLNARDRNSPRSPDQRYDTFNLLKLSGTGSAWEIAVPNGMYTVAVTAGDPTAFDGVYKVNAEGVPTVNGTPTSANRWVSGAKTVKVSDGRLTLRPAAGAKNVKLAFVKITAANPGLTGLTLVNAATDADAGPLVNGRTLNLTTLGSQLNVRANPGANVGSAVFQLDGVRFSTESSRPLALAGDDFGDYRPWTPAVGSHTLVVTPYSGPNATGLAGTPVTVSFTVTRSAATTNASALWGADGEKWSPAGRLADYSFAGYRTGLTPPTPAVVANVKTDFGAVGDGVTDDSDAFLAAIANTDAGTIYVPAGRYKITKVLQIKKSNIVLRGAGPGQSVLFMPESLTTAAERQRPGSDWGIPYTLASPERPFEPRVVAEEWKFRGAFVWVEGRDDGTKLSDVTGGAKRGGRTLSVADGSRFSVGQSVRLLQWDDPAKTLGRHLHADQQDAGPQLYERASNRLVDWSAKVVAVAGNQVTLDRPLKVDVRASWTPQLYSHLPAVHDVGIENLGFDFAADPYPGHLKEKGYNAIFMKQVADCWVRNVWTTDADNAVNLEWMVRNTTVENVRVMAERRLAGQHPSGWTGHHGLQVAYHAQDNLFRNFRFDTHYAHDITVDTLVNGNVFTGGSGVQLNFDHHRGAPYDNLFTDLDVGRPVQTWNSGGDGLNGPNAAARATFWNVRAANGANMLALPNWVQMTAVGLKGYSQNLSATGQWVEATGGSGVLPVSLYEAMRDNRFGT